LAGATDEKRHGAATLTADMDFSLENEHHVFGRRAFFKENVAGVGLHLFAVAGEPKAFLIGQAM
jgi:hypothetical protein